MPIEECVGGLVISGMESPAEKNFSAVQNLKRQKEMSPNTRKTC